MKRLLAVLVCCALVSVVSSQQQVTMTMSTAEAQVGGVRDVAISSITGGATPGRMSNEYAIGVPDPANRRYADTSDAWANLTNAFPGRWNGAFQLRTLDSDASTTGDTTQYSLTVDGNVCMSVWHDDAQVSKPTWLTTNFAFLGETAFFTDTIDAEGYFGNFPAGTYNFGGNCPGGGCTGTPEMYVVSILPGWDCSGSVDTLSFVSAAYNGNESTNVEFQVTRSGTGSGAAAVTISEGENPANGVLNTLALSWSDTELGPKTGDIDLAAVGADTTMTVVLSNPSGAVVGNPSTATINIFDVPASPTLTYNLGGDPTDPEDPGLDVVAAKRRYVCSNGGNDADDGLTQANAWASVAKVVAEAANIPDGSIIAFCRGGQWNGFLHFNPGGNQGLPGTTGDGTPHMAWGSAGNITAFGAYGAGAPPLFARDVRFYNVSFFTVRDWRVNRVVTEGDTHDFLVAYVDCGATDIAPENCLTPGGPGYHGVLVENVVHDIIANDLISVHTSGPNNTVGNRDGWWVIGNWGIGGAEECIDVSTSNVGDPIWGDDGHLTQDIKVIGNKCAGQPLAGFSTTGNSSAGGITTGHSALYTWVVANYFAFAKSKGFSLGTDGNPNRDFTQVTGNVVWDTGGPWMDAGNVCFAGEELELTHNTMLHVSTVREIFNFWDESSNPAPGCESITFTHNILFHTQAPTFDSLAYTGPDGDIDAWDSNWYGSGTTRDIRNGMTFAEHQAMTAFDDNSQQGALTGITAPDQPTWGDPRTWDDPDFIALLTPDTGWAGCNGANTPGARGCAAAGAAGAALGWQINPMAGGPNNGCGWNGGDFAPLVKAKLIALGVTYHATCATAWGF